MAIKYKLALLFCGEGKREKGQVLGRMLSQPAMGACGVLIMPFLHLFNVDFIDFLLSED